MDNRREFLKLALGGVLCTSSLALVARTNSAGPRADYFPNSLLHAHTGEKLRFYDDVIKGQKIVVLNMMYSICSNICPANTANLLQVQKILGDLVGRDVFMYSLTLRPELDTPEALEAYAKKYGVQPGWKFLTGKPAEMDVIRRKLGFYDTDPERDADITQHTGMVRIGREDLDRWSMMPALLKPERLAKTIMNLQIKK